VSIGLAALILPAALLLTPSSPKASPPTEEMPPAQPNVIKLAASLGCPNPESTFTCLDEFAAASYAKDGVVGLVSTVESWRDAVKPDGLPCHRLMHVFGKNLAESGSLQEIAAQSSETVGVCANGFFHGVVEGMALHLPATELPQRMREFCSSVPGLGSDCAHSSGHAFAMRNHTDAYAALEKCDVFAEQDSILCGSGVFMTFGRGLPGFEDEMSDPWINYTPEVASSICQSVAEKYTTHCWFLLWMAYLNNPTLGGAQAYEQVCSALALPDPEKPSEAYRNCYRGLGMLYVGRSSRPAAETAAMCPTTKDSRYWCVFSVGWSPMYDHFITFDTKDGYESICTDLSPADLKACKDGEVYVREDEGGL
jgi:hypothetical protein